MHNCFACNRFAVGICDPHHLFPNNLVLPQKEKHFVRSIDTNSANYFPGKWDHSFDNVITKRHWCRSGVLIVKFEHVSYLFVVFPGDNTEIRCKPLTLYFAIYLCITSRFTYIKHLFCWQFILIFLYLTLAWMFFFRTLATAFPTSYRMKTICTCWVLKLSNDACPLNHVLNAS